MKLQSAYLICSIFICLITNPNLYAGQMPPFVENNDTIRILVFTNIETGNMRYVREGQKIRYVRSGESSSQKLKGILNRINHSENSIIVNGKKLYLHQIGMIQARSTKKRARSAKNAATLTGFIGILGFASIGLGVFGIIASFGSGYEVFVFTILGGPGLILLFSTLVIGSILGAHFLHPGKKFDLLARWIVNPSFLIKRR